MKERTFVLVKPDAVSRGLIGEILHRFERVGLKVISLKMVHVDEKHAKNHYPVTEKWYNKVGTNTLNDSVKYGLDVRKTIGTDNPVEIGKKVHIWNVNFLTSGPVIALVVEGTHAIEVVRKIAGATVPNLAQPGTIRGDHASASALSSNIKNRAIYNLVHTSDTKEEAEREIKLWFKASELYDYKTIYDSDLV